MNISAATDYGMRALLYLTEVYLENSEKRATVLEIASAQKVPVKFLESILRQLQQAGLINSKRGANGGYRLAKKPKEISVATVIRILDGPLIAVKGEKPEDHKYSGSSGNLQEVWIAARVAVREILEEVTLQQIATGALPAKIKRAIDQPGAWTRRSIL